MIHDQPLACTKQSWKTGKVLRFPVERVSIARSKQTYEEGRFQLQITFLLMTDVLGLFVSSIVTLSQPSQKNPIVLLGLHCFYHKEMFIYDFQGKILPLKSSANLM